MNTGLPIFTIYVNKSKTRIVIYNHNFCDDISLNNVYKNFFTYKRRKIISQLKQSIYKYNKSVIKIIEKLNKLKINENIQNWKNKIY